MLPRLLSILFSFSAHCICVCLEKRSQVSRFKKNLVNSIDCIFWSITIAIFVNKPCQKGDESRTLIAFYLPKVTKNKGAPILAPKDA